ncbi:DUF5958 family protein [Streptomyces canus]|uniref:DUF5958 family protein n=1 Tax=Streptomyces canus TaxID=58343 RepID=UPI002DD8096C|nr:DUF5958 family protein [Streptomyces canus]WSD87519.1 DUF5958 family protein [Streptomyces canus]
MLYAHEVVLNELAQGLRPTAEGVDWFEVLSEDDQRKVVHALVLFCGQAHARRRGRVRPSYREVSRHELLNCPTVQCQRYSTRNRSGSPRVIHGGLRTPPAALGRRPTQGRGSGGTSHPCDNSRRSKPLLL